MLHYVRKRAYDTPGSSKESIQHSPGEDDSYENRVHSENEQQLQNMEESAETGEMRESDSSDDTTHRISEVKEESSEMLRDVFFWQIPLTDNFRIEITKTGSAAFQNKDGPFSSVSRQGMRAKGGSRQLSKDWFFKIMPNGQKSLRSWMVYSPVSEKLHCFCCRLFTSHATKTTSKFVTGFQAWWKLNPRVQDPERSVEHLRCLEQWKTLEISLRLQKNN
ncbi:unnamed protein product [Ixodes persulcatus]